MSKFDNVLGEVIDLTEVVDELSELSLEDILKEIK